MNDKEKAVLKGLTIGRIEHTFHLPQLKEWKKCVEKFLKNSKTYIPENKKEKETVNMILKKYDYYLDLIKTQIKKEKED